MRRDPRLTTNDKDGLAAAVRCAGHALHDSWDLADGTADDPTVSSSDRGDQLHRKAQSAELSEARAGRPSRSDVL